MTIKELINLGIYDENERVVIVKYSNDYDITNNKRFSERKFRGRMNNIPEQYENMEILNVGSLEPYELLHSYKIDTSYAYTGIFIGTD